MLTVVVVTKLGEEEECQQSLRESFPCPKHHARCIVCIILILTTFEISIRYFHIPVEEIPPGELVYGLRASEYQGLGLNAGHWTLNPSS